MAPERLDRHGDRKARELFEENTAEIGTLSDIVDKHVRDVLIPGESEPGVGGADSGESDFESEMLDEDPPTNWESRDDAYFADDDEPDIGETDITGTAAGIARGFGSHVAQDLGADGFQIEEIPTRALERQVRGENEELDDYDDDDPNNGKYDPKDLEELSIPGALLEQSREIDSDAGVTKPKRGRARP